MEVEAIPQVDVERNIVLMDKLRVTSKTSSGLFDLLTNLINLPIIRDKIADMLQYNYARDQDVAVNELNAALNKPLGNGLELKGQADIVAVEELRIGDGFIAPLFFVEGKLEIVMNISP